VRRDVRGGRANREGEEAASCEAAVVAVVEGEDGVVRTGGGVRGTVGEGGDGDAVADGETVAAAMEGKAVRGKGHCDCGGGEWFATEGMWR